jgi:hypothetical protein
VQFFCQLFSVPLTGWLSVLHHFVNRTDDKIYRLSLPRLPIQDYNRAIDYYTNKVGSFQFLDHGPVWLSKMLADCPTDLDDQDRMNMGLRILETWRQAYEKGTIDRMVGLDDAEGVTDLQRAVVSANFQPRECYTAPRELPLLGRRIIFALAANPDPQDIMAAWLLMRVRGLSHAQDDLAFIFGDDWRSQFDGDIADYQVVEIGPEARFVIDGQNCTPPESTGSADSVYLTMCRDEPNKDYRKLVSYARFRAGHSERTIGTDQLEQIQRQYAIMPEDMQEQVRWNVRTDAPAYLFDLLPQLGQSVSNLEQLLYGFILFEGWIQKNEDQVDYRRLIDQSLFVARNGLQFAQIPLNSTSEMRRLRTAMGDPKYRSLIDVYVTQFQREDMEDDDTRFAVTVTGNGEEISGMAELTEFFYQLEPRLRRPTTPTSLDGDIFLHKDKWTLYINCESGLTLELVWDAVLEHLSHRQSAAA